MVVMVVWCGRHQTIFATVLMWLAAGSCVAGSTCPSRRNGCSHVVKGSDKIQLLGGLTATGGMLAFCGKREHEVSVYNVAGGPKLEIKGPQEKKGGEAYRFRPDYD
ncbi:hypothetical protein BJY52DRAFT_1311078 [Lactarius psammicola]|nr:hypothetical protein BJY52DRAFT_1311078 [Lactarius psammicola]